MGILRRFTLRCLLENKTRTLVTIIGIVLSVALFTAVAEGAYSGQQYLIDTAVAAEGHYHISAVGMSPEGVDQLRQNPQVDQLATFSALGWAMVAPENEYYPYLYVQSCSDNIQDLLAIRLQEGRMPENDTELIVGNNLAGSSNFSYQVGQSVTLELGRRVSEGEPLSFTSPYLGQEEQLVDASSRTFTVVGIFERLSGEIEPYSMPGCMALTCGAESSEKSAFFTLHNINEVYSFVESYPFEENTVIGVNRDLLLFHGASGNENLIVVLYGLLIILFLLIMFGSVALIYNSFSISVAERTRQFGLLKSIGATRKQIRATVLAEAMMLCVVAIPLGLVVGCAGIGLTLYALRDQFSMIVMGGQGIVPIHLVLNAPALAAAAVVGLVTALISAYIPARRAMRIMPIDAIRMSKDIRVTRRNVKTGKLTYKIFGFPGMLASKYYKRNRKGYRATVVSLFMSVVLFISASSFSQYLRRDIAANISNNAFDISATVYTETPDEMPDPEAVLRLLSGAEQVDRGVYTVMVSQNLEVSLEAVNPDGPVITQAMEDSGKYLGPVYTFYLQDSEYAALCSQAGVDPALGQALIYDFTAVLRWTEEQGTVYHASNLLQDKVFPLQAELVEARYRIGDWMLLYYDDTNPEGPAYIYAKAEGDGYDPETEKRFTPEQSELRTPVTVAARLDKAPLASSEDTVCLYLPYSAFGQASRDEQASNWHLRLYFSAENHAAARQSMESLIAENENSYSGAHIELWDSREGEEATRAMVLVLDVFTYGFIVLISLIAAANVFNTISTNIMLRRKEFATLKSVGMDRKGFGRMLRFECLLYGTRSLLYGLPVSLLLSYAIYKVVTQAFTSEYLLPWASMLIAVGSVFLVVFATMLYSMHKVNRQNIIETLRNENT